MSVVLTTKHSVVVDITDANGEATDRRYLLAVPTIPTRARFRSALAAAGVIAHAHAEFAAAARETLLEVNTEETLGLLSLCDRVAEVGPSALEGDDAVRWKDVSNTLMRVDPRYRQLVADNTYYLEMAPVIAARVFLTGWENTGLPFQPGLDGLISNDLIEAVAEKFRGDLFQIWVKIVAMLSPDQSAEKNSASPSPSSGSPEVSAAAAKSSKNRSTAARGASSATDTKPTH